MISPAWLLSSVSEEADAMRQSAMTLSRACVPEDLTADTPMTSTPSSMTRAIAARTLMLDNCVMITASTASLDILRSPRSPLPQPLTGEQKNVMNACILCSLQWLIAVHFLGVATCFTVHARMVLRCKRLCRGRCARGAACRYSHDFSALTAASPLMPALTAAAAAAAIAQISMNPGGLLPQIAPYLQSYMPPAPQHTSLQQHMLHERMHSSAPVLPHPFPFAKANFPQAGLPRDVGTGHGNSFGVPSPQTSFGAPYTGLTAHSGWQAGSQMSHNSSLLSQRLQAQQASKHMCAPLQDQSRERNSPLLAAQKSLPELYGVPGTMATAPVGGRSYDSAQTGITTMASRNAGASAAAVQRPLYSPFEALQGLSLESPPLSKPEILISSLADRQPSLRSPIMALGTDAMREPLPPPDGVAIPTRPASTPRLTHAYPSITAPPAAARSLSFTDLHFDRETSPPMQSLADSLSANQPEQKSVDRLCFEAASLGISAPTGKLSAAEVEVECHSSTSDSSSVLALEVSL
ncbi:TPA: hypothetical protein ACH3X2_004020 [Trebouxia sp. C0005]